MIQGKQIILYANILTLPYKINLTLHRARLRIIHGSVRIPFLDSCRGLSVPGYADGCSDIPCPQFGFFQNVIGFKPSFSRIQNRMSIQIPYLRYGRRFYRKFRHYIPALCIKNDHIPPAQSRRTLSFRRYRHIERRRRKFCRLIYLISVRQVIYACCFCKYSLNSGYMLRHPLVRGFRQHCLYISFCFFHISLVQSSLGIFRKLQPFLHGLHSLESRKCGNSAHQEYCRKHDRRSTPQFAPSAHTGIIFTQIQECLLHLIGSLITESRIRPHSPGDNPDDLGIDRLIRQRYNIRRIFRRPHPAEKMI